MKAGDWLSTREAAEMLGVSEATVRRWSDRGALPVRRVGMRGERRFQVGHVRSFEPPGPARPAEPVPPPASTVLLGGRAVDTSNHLAVFYDTDAGRLRLSAPFLQDGLLAGEPCFLIAAGDVLQAYLERLRRVPGLDLDAAMADGGLMVAETPGTTAEEAVEFWETACWKAVAKPASTIRLVGEMACVRDRFISESEMLAFEAAVNLTLKRFPCVALCQYDVRQFSGQTLLGALRTHPDLFSQPLGPFLS